MNKSALIGFALALCMPFAANAAYNNVTLSQGSVNISVAGINLSVSGSTNALNSIMVNGTSFTFFMNNGSSLQVTSADRRLLGTDQTSYISTNTCDSSSSVLGYSYTGTDQLMVTITPSSSTCGASATVGGSAGSSSVGGGGFAGGSSGFIAIPVSTTSSTAPSMPGCPKGYACTKPSTMSATATAPGLTIAAMLTKTLSKGASSSQVSALQTLLAKDKTIYPQGTVSGYFGPLTLKAVQAFQVKYGVAKPGDTGYGVVGPKTRAALAKVFGN